MMDTELLVLLSLAMACGAFFAAISGDTPLAVILVFVVFLLLCTPL
jgi:hypothetical protein